MNHIIVTIGLGVLGVTLLSTILSGAPYIIACFALGLVVPPIAEKITD